MKQSKDANSRFSKIRQTIIDSAFDAILISSVPNIIYLTNYAGFSKDEREALLFITKDQQYIITDGRYTEVVYKTIPHFTLIELSPNLSFKQIFQALAKKHKVKKLGIEENNITVSEYKILKFCFNDLNHSNIDEFREVKTDEEIANIQKACEIGDKAFNYVLNKLKAGITEKQLAFEFEAFIKQQNTDLSFRTIIAFGSNSSLPHHVTSNRKLKTNTIVLMDFGVKVNNYCSDMTRTVFFGKADARFKKIYQTVLDSQQRAIDLLIAKRYNDAHHYNEKQSNNVAMKHLHVCSSNESRLHRDESRSSETNSFHLRSNNKLKASDLDKVARNYIIEQGFSSIPHSLGHGIGIEIHEAPTLSPKSKQILKPGMVFSIEPGIYIPNYGGVRIEDLVTIDKNSARVLTTAPKNLIEAYG